jgi:hypothetical protein
LTRLRHFPDSRRVNKTHFILYELSAQVNTLVLLVSLNRLYCVYVFLSKVAANSSFMARDPLPGSTWMRLGVTQDGGRPEGRHGNKGGLLRLLRVQLLI